MTQTRSEVIELTHRLAMKGLNRGTKTFLSYEHFRHSLIIIIVNDLVFNWTKFKDEFLP